MFLKKHLKRFRAWLILKATSRVSGLRGNRLTYHDSRLQGCRITFAGRDNIVEIGENVILQGTHLTLIGDGNRITIGSLVRIRAGGNFVAEDGGSRIAIGEGTTMTTPTIVCSEGGSVSIGSDCMVAMNTCIRNSDGHAIFDAPSGRRINPAADVSIGHHVWLGIRALVLKGSRIGDGAIVGANSLVSGEIPSQALAVGSPARAIRPAVSWTRERHAENASMWADNENASALAAQ
jgi:Acetyltransferase (isoleucine patch superfamily)